MRYCIYDYDDQCLHNCPGCSECRANDWDDDDYYSESDYDDFVEYAASLE